MIIRSPYPDVVIPDRSLTDIVLEATAARPGKPALVDGPTGRAITFGELGSMIRATAAGLAARGFGKGDVLAIYSFNVPEYLVAFYGAALAGGMTTTANSLYTAGELAAQLADSGATLLVAAPEIVPRAREAAATSAVREVFAFGEAEGATPFARLLEAGGSPPAVTIDPARDVVALPYSSGTTGLPKGVMLTHRNIVANYYQARACAFMDEADTFVCVLPLYHIYGLVAVATLGLVTGATVVTMPRFDLEQFLRILEEYHVTVAHVVPPILLALAKHPAVDGFDLSAVRTVFSGAAPLGPDLTHACAERLRCAVQQGYGMTETSPVTHLAVGDRVKPGSVGLPVPNTECRVVDVETGEDVGPNREGEIWIRGPQVMRGYLNNPEATARTVDAEGWLHTGDVGYVDDDGYFFIVDRVKELIKFKGLQVAPAQLEALLLTHPAVADAAVVPCPDAEAGEVPAAFVVRRGEATADELMEFVAERVAPYKKIRSVEFVDQIPKSAAGKILRRVLKERVRARAT